MSVGITSSLVEASLKKSFGRRSILNYDLSVNAIRKMKLPQYYTDNVTIIDAYPGIGIWSAALHNELKPANHVLLEPLVGSQKFLKKYIDPSKNTLKLWPEDPFRWATYENIVAQNIVTPISHPRTAINPHLLFTCNLSSVQGEQLCVQFLNCVMNRNWLQKYGRVRMLLWVRYSTVIKLLATPGSKRRGRVSVQTEACSDTRLIIGNKLTTLELDHQPHEPLEMITHSTDIFPNTPNQKMPMALIQVDPHEADIEQLDYFEYIIRTLFILKTRPLKEGLAILGPGALDDLGLSLRPLLNKRPADMTLEDFFLITKAFGAWPFRPEHLHDFYAESDYSLANTSFNTRD